MTNRKTQRGRILELLIGARGAWVPLPDILALGVAQYSARVCELRKLGFRIENRKERVDGKLHTYFRLNGGSTIAPRPAPVTSATAGSDSLFGNLAKDRTYLE